MMHKSWLEKDSNTQKMGKYESNGGWYPGIIIITSVMLWYNMDFALLLWLWWMF